MTSLIKGDLKQKSITGSVDKNPLNMPDVIMCYRTSSWFCRLPSVLQLSHECWSECSLHCCLFWQESIIIIISITITITVAITSSGASAADILDTLQFETCCSGNKVMIHFTLFVLLWFSNSTIQAGASRELLHCVIWECVYVAKN